MPIKFLDDNFVNNFKLKSAVAVEEIDTST
jgi:hypothetical protein